MLEKYIPIIKRDETCKIYIRKILLIEQELRKTLIHTEEGKYWRYGKIEELIKFLDERFLRCHQSYIINMDKVNKMKGQVIYFENGNTITIGKEKFQQAKQSFGQHIMSGAEE